MGLLISSYLIEFGSDEQTGADDLLPEDAFPPLERHNAMVGESEFSNYFNAMGEL